ncbi:MAG: phytanoyl-CoA dioxygenase family protein [Cyclobacteriaceae bacterium]
MNLIKQQIATRIKCWNENLSDRLHRSGASTRQLNSEAISKIKSSGFVVMENFKTEDWCDTTRNDIENILINHSSHVWIDEHGSDHRIFGAENGSNHISSFYTDPTCQQIGESYLATRLYNHMTLAAKLEASMANLGSGGGWHRDSTYEHQFKAILYLSDVNENNGPFQFVTRSHTTQNVLKTIGYGQNNNRYSHDEIEMLCSKHKWKIETFTAKKGTLILVDTKGLHRGMPILESHRFALTNYYIGDYKKERFEKYFQNLKKLPPLE